MAKRAFAVFFPAFTLLISSGQGDTNSLPECQAWKNVTDLMKANSTLKFDCSVNPACTGFECSGGVKFGDHEESLRLGLTLRPCSNPLRFDFTITNSLMSYNFTVDLGRNQKVGETRILPDEIVKIGPLGGKGNLTYFLSSTISPDGLQLITIQVDAAVQFLGLAYSFVLIPKSTVAFPSCSASPTLVTEASSTAGAQVPSSSPPVEQTGESCSWMSLEKPCPGAREQCVGDRQTPGRCFCSKGLFWDPDRKQCVDEAPSKKAGGSDTWVIVGGVVASCVVVGAILVVIAVKYSRYRQRYGQHQLLVDRENDTELDDPDPPMLSG